MNKVTVMFLLLVSGMMFTACDGTGGCDTPTTIALTAADNGQTVAMGLDDQIKVTLDSNPSTGYRWVNMLTEGSLIVQIGDSEYVEDPGCGGADGCGGTETFIFGPVQSGTGAIKLYYTRSDGIEPIDEFFVTIDVD